MELLRGRLHEGIMSSRMLEAATDGAPVTVAGLVACRQRPGTAAGIVFITLEDEFGLMNLIVWPDLSEAQRGQVKTNPFLVVKGQLQKRDGTVNVVAQRIDALDAREFLALKAHNFR